MRIAFDSQIFWMQKYGGISRYFINLCQLLNSTKHTAKIFAPIHTNEYIRELNKELYFGQHINKFAPKTGIIFGIANNFTSSLLISKWKADIVHKTYYHSHQKFKIPSILTVYDLIHEKFPLSFTKNDKTIYHKKKAIKNADHIICISKSTQNDLINYYGIDEHNTSVVYLGFQLQNFKPLEKNVHILNEPYILFVGNRDGYKNFDTFVKAIVSSNVAKTIKVVCFGGGNFSTRQKNFIQSVGGSFSQFVHISGDDDLLATVYRRARAFVYPSKYEGFGLPPLEAMANGCPVTCSNTSSIPEVVENAAEFFDPSDVDSMRFAIERVILNESRRSELKALGYAQIQKFSWNRCAEQTLQIYMSLK